MMPIIFNAAELSPDEAIKQKTALQQMQDLLERVSAATKYRILTPTDRATLLKEGYAQDLVDNLVLVTERVTSPGLEGDQYTDQIVAGFTHAAFDPSLYANQTIMKNIRHSHSGRCAFCETYLEATAAGCVAHFRPSATVIENCHVKRSPYYTLAYDQHNLFYACIACADINKHSRFPVKGERTVDIAQENAMLIYPYTEHPRSFIRFNTLNGNAYPFDLVLAFYKDVNNYSVEQIEKLLWQSPQNIPLQSDIDGNSLSDENVNQQFLQWQKKRPQDQTRGQITIDCCGLNRADLAVSRKVHALSLKSIYTNDFTSIGALALTEIDEWINNQLPLQLQYLSLSIDVLHTYLEQNSNTSDVAFNGGESGESPTSDVPSSSGTINLIMNTITNINSLASLSIDSKAPPFPTWITSSLMYIVLENELQIANKRRLICLSGNDYLYGSDNPDKCVFLPINWSKDTNNVIKVRTKNNVWETSFNELAASREMEINNLFANNEVWVEGEYFALA